MIKNGLLCFYTVTFLFFTCKMQPGSDRHYADDNPNKVYKLRLNPAAGAVYDYDITNGAEFKMKVDDKEVDNQSKSTAAVSYAIDKDSAGDFVLNIVYNKIHLSSKKKDEETEMDADHNANSSDRVEKLLALMKGTAIQATISPRGDIKSIQGYDDLKAKIMASFNADDAYGKAMAGKQWDQRIKEGLIKKNMEELFKIFPDSAVHVGDKWKLSSVQKDEVSLDIKSTYILKDIRDGVAIIESEGEVSSDNTVGSSMGYEFTADLKGKQEGDFEMETATGMILSSRVTADIDGEMEIMGRKVPITIRTTMKMEGKKVK